MTKKTGLMWKVLGISVLSVGLLSAPNVRAADFINIGGGASGGTYIVVATGMAKILTKHVSDHFVFAKTNSQPNVATRSGGGRCQELSRSEPASLFGPDTNCQLYTSSGVGLTLA